MKTTAWVKCDKLVQTLGAENSRFIFAWISNRVCKFEGFLRKFAETFTGY